MNINWTQPITVYELIAIALSTIALIIPLIKYIYNHFNVNICLFLCILISQGFFARILRM